MRTLLDFLADTGRPGCPAAIQGEAEGFLLYAELYAWGKVTIRLIGCGFREGEVLPRGWGLWQAAGSRCCSMR